MKLNYPILTLMSVSTRNTGKMLCRWYRVNMKKKNMNKIHHTPHEINKSSLVVNINLLPLIVLEMDGFNSTFCNKSLSVKNAIQTQLFFCQLLHNQNPS